MATKALKINVFTGEVKIVEPSSLFCSVCGFVVCVCKVRREHEPDCRFRKAMECPVGIECEHDCEVCPTCDPCTCGVREVAQ